VKVDPSLIPQGDDSQAEVKTDQRVNF